MTVRSVSIRIRGDGSAEVRRELREVGEAGERAYRKISAAADGASSATDKAQAKTRSMAELVRQLEQQDAKAAAQRLERFNAYLGVRDGRPSAEIIDLQSRRASGLSAFQRRALLLQQGGDVLASLASGINPAMVVAQQAPQILEALALQGGHATSSLLKLMGVIGGLAVAVGAGTAAWLSHNDALRAADALSQGLALRTGLTAEQIEALARASAEQGRVTTGAARDMVAAYLGTGRIGAEVTERLTALTRRYAVATQQEAKTAVTELARAFADPAKGADTLNGKLAFLDDRTRRLIATLVAQNRETEAQLVLADALAGRLDKVADHVSTLGGVWNAVKRAADAAWQAMGRGIAVLSGGNQSDLERLAELESRRRLRPVGGRGLLTSRPPAWWAEEDREAEAIRARIRQRQADAERARQNQVVADARAAAERANPSAARLRELEQDRARIEAGLRTGAMTPETQRDARKALAEINKEISAMRAGYSSAAAQASTLGRASREAARDARQAAREREEAERNAQRLAELRLRNELEIARLGVGPAARALTIELERQLRVQQLTDSFASAGVSKAQARAEAERQVSREMVAQYEALRAQTLLEASDGSFVSTERAMARIGALRLTFDDNTEALEIMEQAGVRAFDALADTLAQGELSWKSWKDAARMAIGEVVSDLTRLLLINPLRNALFGGISGYQPLPTLGLGALFGGLRLPGFAAGTSFAPGGWARVGETGEELVNLPRGAQVFPANRARGLGAAPVIQVQINAEAGVTKAEVEGMVERGMRAAVREAGAQVIPLVNDGLQRRMIA